MILTFKFKIKFFFIRLYFTYCKIYILNFSINFRIHFTYNLFTFFINYKKNYIYYAYLRYISYIFISSFFLFLLFLLFLFYYLNNIKFACLKISTYIETCCNTYINSTDGFKSIAIQEWKW